MKKLILLTLISFPLYAEFGSNGYVVFKDKKSTVTARTFFYPNKDFLLVGSDSLNSKWFATFNEKGEHQKTITSTLHTEGSVDTYPLKDGSIFQVGRTWITKNDSRIVIKKISKTGVEDTRFGKFGEKTLWTGSTYEQDIFAFELDNGNVGMSFYKKTGNDERVALMQITPQGDIDPQVGVQVLEDKWLSTNQGTYLKKYGTFFVHPIFDPVAQAYTETWLVLYGWDGKRIKTFGNKGTLQYKHPKGFECYRYNFEEEKETGNLIIHTVCSERGRKGFYQNLYHYDPTGKLISEVKTLLPIGEYYRKVFQNGEVFYIEFNKDDLKITAYNTEGQLKEKFGKKGVLNLQLPVPPKTDTNAFFYMTHESIDPQGRILLVYSAVIREPKGKYHEPILMYRILPDGRLDN